MSQTSNTTTGEKETGIQVSEEILQAGSGDDSFGDGEILEDMKKGDEGKTSQDTSNNDTPTEGETGGNTPPIDDSEPVYSVFTPTQKVSIVLLVSFLAIISPLSGQIYLPAITALSEDLHVSVSLLNLTITHTTSPPQIFQGIAPSFIGNFSDIYGRRPAYIICFGIYMCANIGLALQNSYAALMVLRCFQSMGSSATIALSSATVADLVTRAERGKFIGYAAMGVTLGPALGPTAGGLLTQTYGWRGIFWFLAVLSATLFLIMLAFLPETCRNVVGNGSVVPPKWNMSLVQLALYSRLTRAERQARHTETPTLQRGKRRPNPFAALRILREREGGVTLGCGALMAAGYFMVLTTLSPQLATRFGFSPIHVGLCYLPLGFGTLSSRWTIGYVLDWNFRRWARKLGVVVDKQRQQSLDVFPIEKIRLQVSIVAVYMSCVAVVAYGWTMHERASLAGIEVAVFFLGLFFAGAMNGINTLIVDTHPESPATAVAANNLFRCLVSAGAIAVALPLIDRIGMGPTSMVIAGVWICFSPLLWVVMFQGARWREEDQERKERKRKEADGRV